MKIKNKLDSIQMIQKLGLNRFPEKVFHAGEEDKVIDFLKEFPATYYAIRDKSKSSGEFKLKVKYNDVLKEIKNYSLFSINVSSANYAKNQVLVGEIQILDSLEVYATLTTDCNASVRDALKKTEFNIKTTIFDDDTLEQIPYFSFLYDYICSHDLKNVIVEFSLFNIEVGLYHEKIVIYELRTDY